MPVRRGTLHDTLSQFPREVPTASDMLQSNNEDVIRRMGTFTSSGSKPFGKKQEITPLSEQKPRRKPLQEVSGNPTLHDLPSDVSLINVPTFPQETSFKGFASLTHRKTTGKAARVVNDDRISVISSRRSSNDDPHHPTSLDQDPVLDITDGGPTTYPFISPLKPTATPRLKDAPTHSEDEDEAKFIQSRYAHRLSGDELGSQSKKRTIHETDDPDDKSGKRIKRPLTIFKSGDTGNTKGDKQTPDSEKRPFRKRLKEMLEDPQDLVNREMKKAKDRDDEWTPVGDRLTIEISANRWNVFQHEDNLARQRRRTRITTYENINGKEKVVGEEVERSDDLAISEYIGARLDGQRIDHITEYTEASYNILNQYRDKIDAFKTTHSLDNADIINGTLTRDQGAELQTLKTEFDAKMKEAFDKCKKGVDAVDSASFKKADEKLMEIFRWDDAKDALKTNYAGRIKSNNDKMTKNSADLAKNEGSIEKSLATLEGGLSKVTLLNDARTDGASSSRTAISPTKGELVTRLRDYIAALDRSDNTYSRAADNIEELNIRVHNYATTRLAQLKAGHANKATIDAHETEVKALKDTIIEVKSLFSDRKLLLDAKDALVLKDRRYKRPQDAEAMLYNEELSEHMEQMAEAKGRLAAAEHRFAELTSAADRMYKVVKTGGDPLPYELDGQSLEGQTSQEKVERVQLKLEQTRILVDELKQTVAEQQEMERVIAKKVELANGRYATNEAREKDMRDAIGKMTEQTLANMRKTYEQIVVNQRKIDVLQINVHLLALQARRMAVTGMMGTAPNAMQRETQSMMGNIQTFMR
jgi:hypothetical protein